jgi:hypothetical protein
VGIIGAGFLRRPTRKTRHQKVGLRDQGPEGTFSSPIRETETKPCLRNVAVARPFKGSAHVDPWRLDWLAGAAGFETLHLLRGSGAGLRDRCVHRRCSQPAAPIYFPTTFRSASLILPCQPGPAS